MTASMATNVTNIDKLLDVIRSNSADTKNLTVSRGVVGTHQY